MKNVTDKQTRLRNTELDRLGYSLEQLKLRLIAANKLFEQVQDELVDEDTQWTDTRLALNPPLAVLEEAIETLVDICDRKLIEIDADSRRNSVQQRPKGKVKTKDFFKELGVQPPVAEE